MKHKKIHEYTREMATTDRVLEYLSEYLKEQKLEKEKEHKEPSWKVTSI